jgi:hypothetical protein
MIIDLTLNTIIKFEIAGYKIVSGSSKTLAGGGFTEYFVVSPKNERIANALTLQSAVRILIESLASARGKLDIRKFPSERMEINRAIVKSWSFHDTL